MNPYVIIICSLVFMGLSPIPLAPVRAPYLTFLGEGEARQIRFTDAPSSDVAPFRKLNDSLGVQVTAASAYMIARDTGKVVYDANSMSVRPIASITKLMSLMVITDELADTDAMIEIEQGDYTPFGTTTLRVGERVRGIDLIAAAIIGSDNTAIRALARATGVSPEVFVSRMQENATELGLRSTSFADVTGLSEKNVSTAREVAVMAERAFRNQVIARFAGERSHSFTSEDGREHVVRTTNRLIGSFIPVRFGKTGYVSESGYNLVAVVSDDAEHEYLGVILGSATTDDRFHDMKMMAYWVWTNFSWSET